MLILALSITAGHQRFVTAQEVEGQYCPHVDVGAKSGNTFTCFSRMEIAHVYQRATDLKTVNASL